MFRTSVTFSFTCWYFNSRYFLLFLFVFPFLLIVFILDIKSHSLYLSIDLIFISFSRTISLSYNRFILFLFFFFFQFRFFVFLVKKEEKENDFSCTIQQIFTTIQMPLVEQIIIWDQNNLVDNASLKVTFAPFLILISLYLLHPAFWFDAFFSLLANVIQRPC